MKKKTTRVLSLAMILMLLCTGMAFAAVPADVAGSAHEEAVNGLIEAGAITGDADGLFHPTDTLTRAQACIIIVKAIDPPRAAVVGTTTQTVAPSGFSDMKGYVWAEGYISYAVKGGLVKGYPDGTFKPGSKVTANEMMTMVLRAAGYTDSEIGTNWPADYVAKASEAGILAGLAGDYPEVCTKEMAAQMAFNKLTVLQERGAKESEQTEQAAGTDALPDLTFATGKFDKDITNFSGTPISDDVVVYTYGVKANYKSDMKLPAKTSEMRLDTVQKFKAAETPCFYAKEDGEITFMILPMDEGFSGKIYGVITGSSSIKNGKGETVFSVHTLAAAQQVNWLTKDDTVKVPPVKDYLTDGNVYEMIAVDGMVKSIEPVTGTVNTEFIELTASHLWEKVDGREGSIVTMDGGDLISVAETATVYVLADDEKSYSVGKLKDIASGALIRAYDISEKDGDDASIVVVKKK